MGVTTASFQLDENVPDINQVLNLLSRGAIRVVAPPISLDWLSPSHPELFFFFIFWIACRNPSSSIDFRPNDGVLYCRLFLSFSRWSSMWVLSIFFRQQFYLQKRVKTVCNCLLVRGGSFICFDRPICWVMPCHAIPSLQREQKREQLFSPISSYISRWFQLDIIFMFLYKVH